MRISMNQPLPIPTMYGISFTYMWLIFVVNVGEHTWMAWVLWNVRRSCEGGFQLASRLSVQKNMPVLWEDFLLTIVISMENSKTQQQLVTGKDQCLERPVVYSPPLTKPRAYYLPWWQVPLLVLVG